MSNVLKLALKADQVDFVQSPVGLQNGKINYLVATYSEAKQFFSESRIELPMPTLQFTQETAPRFTNIQLAKVTGGDSAVKERYFTAFARQDMSDEYKLDFKKTLEEVINDDN